MIADEGWQIVLDLVERRACELAIVIGHVSRRQRRDEIALIIGVEPGHPQFQLAMCAWKRGFARGLPEINPPGRDGSKGRTAHGTKGDKHHDTRR